MLGVPGNFETFIPGKSQLTSPLFERAFKMKLDPAGIASVRSPFLEVTWMGWVGGVVVCKRTSPLLLTIFTFNLKFSSRISLSRVAKL